MTSHLAFVLSSQSNENSSDGLSTKCNANEHTTISARGSVGADAMSSTLSSTSL